MLRRHFRDIADMFPGLPAKLENCAEIAKDSSLSMCTDKNTQSSVKFNSSFSIESLLKKDCSTKRMNQSVQDNGQYAGLCNGSTNIHKTNTWCNQQCTYIKSANRPTYTEHHRNSQLYMYRQLEESTVAMSWRKPIQRTDLSTEIALMCSQQLYGIHNEVHSSRVYTHDLRW